MKQLVFCKNCVWSETDEVSNWSLRCEEPTVNKDNPWLVSIRNPRGVPCYDARKPGWFMACGIKGKKYSHNGNFDLKRPVN